MGEVVARPAMSLNGSPADGAGLVQQFIRAGWLDELPPHVVPVLACGGRRLFDGLGERHIEWEKRQVLDSPELTHIGLRAPRTASAE
ncbi:hypothetical protein ACIBVL_03085 [Streptomyces sp. NPDC049687]|uniref:hypothetical protein n=1 Tax=Streptomyces sp. NPDC049687 TaxID=3365596 RepID=UPI003796EF95